MSKKAKAEVADESAVIITDAVLAENQAKLDSYEKAIKAAQERRRKVIIESKLYTYDIGNPPFVSKANAEQKKDLERFFPKCPQLDYCACFVAKTGKYLLAHKETEAAFLLTSSVCQGSQLTPVWQPLSDKGLVINFAYKPFDWENDLKRRVQASCVIVCFSASERQQKLIFDDGKCISVSRINFALYEGRDLFLPLPKKGEKRKSDRPPIAMGQRISADKLSRAAFLPRQRQGYVRYISAKELLQGRPVYTKPKVFPQLTDYIIIPRHFSAKREYLPAEYFPETRLYCNDSVCLIFGQKATLWIFALLISSMHYTWVKRLSGRLMSNIRYSNSLYEHFPLPRLKETDKQQLSALAKKILQIRAEHYENGTTLAALYDRLPLDLKSAHMQLDNFVEKLYGGVFIGDNERMERLIDVYETRQISGDREYLSDKLKQLRLNKGLTLWALSVKTGIEADLLACYEKRSIVVAKGAIDILAKFYGIDKSELEAYPNNKSGQ